MSKLTVSVKTGQLQVARGVPVGKQRVQKLMQLHGICAKGKRRFKVTTDSLSTSCRFRQTWLQPRVRRSRAGQSLGRRYHVHRYR